MNDMELAEEIERHLAPDAIYWHWEPSMADMEQIIAALHRSEDIPTIAEYSSNPIGNSSGSHVPAPTSMAKPERPPSGEMVDEWFECEKCGMKYLVGRYSAAEAEGRKV